MKHTRPAAILAVTLALSVAAWADHAPEPPVRSLGVVTVNGGRPTSLPSQIPTTMEGVTGEQVEQTVNATDSEDALRYFPSLLVRKRYVGDYNHAVLSSRASGTGNSARSAVYADGILLSNYLGNGVGGLGFPPRWGLVTPEEIERVDVMYGPFSAAYPGNSVGAVVDYVTRMPASFEAHGKLSYVAQPFALYGTDADDRARQVSASAGNKAGALAWFFNVNRTDSEGQPLTFATRLVSAGTPGAAGTPVTGAVAARSNTGAPIWILGTGTEYHTVQDHLKVKLAYDISPTVRAAYTFGLWQNTSDGKSVSYLRNAAGQAVYGGTVNIEGRSFTALGGGDFALSRESLSHVMHGLSVRSRTGGLFDWELAASLYDYRRDDKRQNGAANILPAASDGGAGTIADGAGTGWNTLALKGVWRPLGHEGAHIVDFGLQQDRFRLSYVTSNIAGNWLADPAGPVASSVGGRTGLRSAYAQDVWKIAPHWKAVLGARAEWWNAADGRTAIGNADTRWPQRSEFHASPKAAVSWQWREHTVLKASLGRAVRFPTVGELYGATSTVNAQYINDPSLKPEKSWTAELSAEHDLGNALLRLTLFAERTRDSLYSQVTFDPAANRNISRVQNVDAILTRGLELAYNGSDVFARGLDLGASLTYAHSIIQANQGFVVTPGDTIGKRQPNIPDWRATALASYRWDARWTTSLGARYSGRQFRTLDNSDVNGASYQGVSRYFTVDARVRYQVDRNLTLAFGVDNLNNDRYWNFHPYPQRSYLAELKIDL
jgi:iron complex outermembrane receptor protein